MTTFTTEDRERAEDKPMNANEPVAYRYEDKSNPLVFYFTTRKDKTENPDAIEIPLYAHPAKELTDEEILREAYYILMKEQQRKAQEK
jgi:hypothetical protein